MFAPGSPLGFKYLNPSTQHRTRVPHVGSTSHMLCSTLPHPLLVADVGASPGGSLPSNLSYFINRLWVLFSPPLALRSLVSDFSSISEINLNIYRRGASQSEILIFYSYSVRIEIRPFWFFKIALLVYVPFKGYHVGGMLCFCFNCIWILCSSLCIVRAD